MQIRHPREGDILPVPIFEHYDPDWVWVYGNALLVACPCHDTVMLVRLKKWDEMPPLWIHRLFKQVIKETRERGFRRYLTWLASDVEEEQKLQEIAEKHGASFEPFVGQIVTGVI
jgi:hypothetical protein